MTQEKQPLLTLRGIGRSFPSGEQEVQVLKDVNLDIGNGEMVAIVGASGSGKSTLMNILGCLDRPTTRHLPASRAQDVRHARPRRAGRSCGASISASSSSATTCCRDLTAAGNVEVPAVYAGSRRRDARTRARRALLERLGLGDRTEHRPSQLSGGQQQRVSIARALMNGGRR